MTIADALRPLIERHGMAAIFEALAAEANGRREKTLTSSRDDCYGWARVVDQSNDMAELIRHRGLEPDDEQLKAAA